VDYLLVFGLFVVLGAMPLPTPPGWLILAFARAEYDLALAPLVAAGVLGNATGRVALAASAGLVGPRLLRPRHRANLARLAALLHGPRPMLAVGGLLAVAPPPAGAWYAAAGLLRIPLPLIGASALAGRTVTYTIGAALGGLVASEVTDLLRDWASPWTIALGLAGIALVLWLLVRFDWAAIVARRRRRRAPDSDPA